MLVSCLVPIGKWVIQYFNDIFVINVYCALWSQTAAVQRAASV